MPAIPRGEDGEPVFSAPWQAQAFAMAVEAHGKGLFTWKEWAEALGAALKEGEAEPGNNGYYGGWLTALETLLQRKRIVSESEIRERHDAWDRVARATPHGEPIVLGREDRP
jgi:nitrile hydratase accessory protein